VAATGSAARAAPAAVAPPEAGTTLPAPVQRLEAPTAEGTAVTPLPRPGELRTPNPDAAARTALPSTQDLPAPVRRLESTDGASSVAPLQPAASARATPAAQGASALPELSGALPGQVSAPAGPARGDPNANPYAASKASAGSPEAGSRLGQDLAVPPSAAASAPRAPLNLSLPRSGDIASRRGPGLVEMLPQPPERKSKLEQSIENAANKDCRNAYAGAGILAVVPLAVDAARGKGCKW
jgi:Meckel syndrome type 1 protein